MSVVGAIDVGEVSDGFAHFAFRESVALTIRRGSAWSGATRTLPLTMTRGSEVMSWLSSAYCR